MNQNGLGSIIGVLLMGLIILLIIGGFFYLKKYGSIFPATNSTPQATQSKKLENINLEGPSSNTNQIIPDHYIVVLKSDTIDVKTTIKEISAEYQLSANYVYDSLKGFAAIIPPDKLERLKRDSRILYINEDRKVEGTNDP